MGAPLYQSVQILVIEEQPATCQGLIAAIRQALPATAIATAHSGGQARALIADQSFDLILFDFSLPCEGGLAGLMALLKVTSGSPVLVVCARCEALTISILRSLKVAGVVAKADPLDVITSAVRRTLAGEAVFPESDQVPGAAPVEFSQAQLRVLAALGTGQLNKQIAGNLGVTEATIKAHLSAIFRKLGVTNRTQAMLRARTLFAHAA